MPFPPLARCCTCGEFEPPSLKVIKIILESLAVKDFVKTTLQYAMKSLIQPHSVICNNSQTSGSVFVLQRAQRLAALADKQRWLRRMKSLFWSLIRHTRRASINVFICIPHSFTSIFIYMHIPRISSRV